MNIQLNKIIFFLFSILTLGKIAFSQTVYNYTGTVQTYTVPVGTTSIQIDCWGAQGGGLSGGGGLGAYMSGAFAVTPGQVLNIVVGEMGRLQLGGNAQNSSGGGGGSFVYTASNVLFIASGGGGGKCNYTWSSPLHAGANGQITTSGGSSSDGNAGGSGGLGGNAGLWSSVPCAGGGAGWLSVGGGPYGGMNATTWTGGTGFCGGGGGGCGGIGGFGGGGGGGNHYGGGGGGGGYSGGGGGTDPTHGGGGGSFNSGTSQSNTAGVKTGNGQIVITPLVSCTPVSITPNVASLPTLTGQCSVAAPTAPTATDNCGTIVTGTTTTTFPITTQGTTTITWTYTSGSVTTTQTQTVTITDNTAPGFGAGTLANPFTTTSSTYISTFPSGVYYFNIAGNTFQATVDNTTAGGGWILVLNYVHQGGTNPPIQVRNTNLPIQTGAALGANESGTAAWGHASNSLMNSINPTQLRFYGQTSAHGRVINFTTNYTNGLNYSKTGTGSFSGINNPANYTLLAGHTANIPQNAPDFFINQGDLAMTEFPFWLSGTYHWGIQGFGNRWEVDDFVNNPNFNTIHRIWGRNTNPPTIQTNLPNFTAQCSATPSAPTVTDNCGATITGTTATAFPITTQGTTVVTWTYTDALGNSSTQNQNVIVNDNTPPVANCQNYTVALDLAGNATISAVNIDNGSTDNCGVGTLSVSPSSFTCANLGANTVTLTVTDVNGNSSTCNATVTVVDNIPPVANCQNYTVALDINGNATISAANVNNGSSDNCSIASMTVSPSSFTCAELGANTVTLSVVDNSGNTSTCTSTVTVVDNIPPDVTCQNITVPLDASGNATVLPTDIAPSGPTYVIDQTGPFAPLPVGGTQLFLSDDVTTGSLPIGFNFDFFGTTYSSFTVSSNGFISFDPAVSQGCCSGQIIPQNDFVNNVISWNWNDLNPGAGGTIFYQTIGTAPNRSLVVSYSNVPHFGSGGSNSGQIVLHETSNMIEILTTQVTDDGSTHTQGIENAGGTIAYAVPGRNATNWTANNDYVSFTPLSGVSDNCTVASVTVSPNTFTCANLGANTVTLTAIDQSGNTSTCTSTVTIVDTLDPTAVCVPYTAVLDASGNISITAANVDGGSTDNCTVTSLSVSPSTFTCANLGANTVTLTVTDQSGNISTCNTTVTVVDTLDPTAVCVPYTAVLDASGNISITSANVDGGSTDNCTVASLSVSPNTFTCANLGANTVTLTVTDQSGNISTCNTTVTVVDTLDPTAVCVPYTAVLDASGNISITAANVDGGSTDNCTVASLSVSPNTFTCANLGANTVTLTVTDQSGNTSTCNTTVTVVDTLDPIIVCAPYTAVLDASGNISITAANVDGGTTDNCSIASLTVSPNAFSCANLGANTVTLTAIDQSGNTSTCNATVTVIDTLDPTAVCMPYTAVLDATGNVTISGTNVDGGSTDNCTVASLSVSPNTFTCANLGANTVTLTVTDQSGNTSTCNTTVTVVDTLDPTAVCMPYTAVLDAAGNVTITGVNVDGGSTDNCTVASLSVSPNTFTCANLGANTVTLTVTDQSGNISTCNTTVTVVDTLDPIVVCVPYTAVLDASGNISITAANVDGGTTDNCTVASLSVSPNAFTCANLGANTVTLTAIDQSGNTSTCNTTVTVVDTLDPIFLTTPANINLFNVTGICGRTVTYSAPTFTDNCSVTMAQTDGTGLTSGDVFPVGTTTQTYTLTDISGNTTTYSFTVTITDNENPVIANCPANITVSASASTCGNNVSWSSPVATDNCPAVNMTSTHNPGDFFPVGTTTVTYTATDAAGNVSTCVFTVTVNDNLAPVAPVLATVTGQCSASVTAPTATDNCAGTVTGTTTDPLTYTAEGTYTVTWSFNDGNGNTSTATQTVIVDDNIAPVAPVLATVTGECSASVTAPTATDNCAGTVAGTTTDPLTYTTQGTYTVTWSFNDGNGNTSTATQTVIVDDVTAPVVPVLATVTGECSATVVAPTTTDNCAGVITGTTTDPLTYTAQGTYTVTWTFNDGNGNTSTATQTVVVDDITNPIANCQNFTVALNASGTASITANDINNGSSDNCGIASITASPTTFNCSNVGPNNVTLTVTDIAGNVSTCVAVVTVQDVTPLTWATTPSNVTVNATPGFCGRTVNYVLPTYTDNCTVTMTQTDGTGFTSGDIFPIGTTTQTFTATNAAGEVITHTFTITVNDTQLPVISSCPANITVNSATTTCGTNVTWSAPTASDNCPGVVLTTTAAPGSFFPVGTTTVTYTATDNSGNTANCSFTVTVIDNVAPVVPVLATVTGECSASVTAPTTTDNCSGTLTGTTTDPLTYTTQGTYTVTWTFVDGAGNTTTANQTVIVDDITAPVTPILATVTGECSATITTVPTAADNCSGVITGTTTDPLTYTAQGTYTVTWSFNDGNGNTSTTTQTVIVDDITAPTVPVIADATGECSATATAPTTTDNCSGTITGTTTDSLTYTAQGSYVITWTFDDGNGNTSTATQNVIVNDVTAPTIVAAADTTVDANYFGCSALDLVLSSPVTNDNCQVVSVVNDAPNPLPFGPTTVTWTVTDINGNTASAQQIVTVTSNITGTLDTATCVSYVAPDGASYTSSGVYTATIPSWLGCDSVITINLTILNPTTSTIDVSACGSYTAPDGQEYMTSGVYTAVLTNSVGCDSIITINLDIHNLNLSVGIQQDGTELVAFETGVTYQWFNCTSETIVAGATEQSYVPVLTADYSVILSDGVCTDTTDCYTISLDVVIPEVISPNGDGQNDVFEIIGIEDYPQNHVTIYNRWGQVVFDAAGYSNEWDGTNQSNGAVGTNELPVGTYFYVIDLGPSDNIYVGQVYKGYVYLTR